MWFLLSSGVPPLGGEGAPGGCAAGGVDGNRPPGAPPRGRGGRSKSPPPAEGPPEARDGGGAAPAPDLAVERRGGFDVHPRLARRAGALAIAAIVVREHGQ